MHVNVKDGKPQVKLTVREKKALSDADHVLDMLHRFGECAVSAGAANKLEDVMRKFGIPISEKIEGADASNVKSESEAPSTDSGTETTLPGAIPAVPDTDVQHGSDRTARSRKGSVSPHGIV